jgi:hypothetical protein
MLRWCAPLTATNTAAATTVGRHSRWGQWRRRRRRCSGALWLRQPLSSCATRGHADESEASSGVPRALGAAGRVWQGSEAVEYWAASLAVSYDVVVVGAGVVGCALARELSLRRCLPREVRQPHEQQQQQQQHQEGRLRVLLLDARHDVGEATSKGNAAIVHTGFDAEPGTLESDLVVQASREWPALAKRLQIPYRECGALLVARDAEQAAALPGLRAKALANGVEDVRLLSAAEVLELEPRVTAAVQGVSAPT